MQLEDSNWRLLNRALPHCSLHYNQAGPFGVPHLYSFHLRAFAYAETLSIPHYLDLSAIQISDVIP